MSVSPELAATPDLARWVSVVARRAFERDVRAQGRQFATIEEARAVYGRQNSDRLRTMRALHAVAVTPMTIGGVGADLVVPEGTAPGPDSPILLAVHGGAFAWGAGDGALLEAVPIATASGLPVLAVDYRMAPEHVFPAATDDVVAVYRALLQERPAERIGLYGCSAGAVLVAQVLARLQSLGAPRLGAAAMFHAAGLELGGDSAALAPGLNGDAPSAGLASLMDLPYFAGADPEDPLVFPGEHPAVLAGFPPSLLVTSTRDFAASAVSVMHRRLLAAGADAEFILFDGLWHAFHMDGELPESAELYARTAEFFRRRLA